LKAAEEQQVILETCERVYCFCLYGKPSGFYGKMRLLMGDAALITGKGVPLPDGLEGLPCFF
jgi:hypothetical protein